MYILHTHVFIAHMYGLNYFPAKEVTKRHIQVDPHQSSDEDQRDALAFEPDAVEDDDIDVVPVKPVIKKKKMSLAEKSERNQDLYYQFMTKKMPSLLKKFGGESSDSE